MRSVNNAAATVPVATMFFAFFVEASTGLCESNLEGRCRQAIYEEPRARPLYASVMDSGGR